MLVDIIKKGAVNMEAVTFLVPFLIYIGVLFLGIFAVIYFLKLTKERNQYLKDIRDELRKRNI